MMTLIHLIVISILFNFIHTFTIHLKTKMFLYLYLFFHIMFYTIEIREMELMSSMNKNTIRIILCIQTSIGLHYLFLYISSLYLNK